MAKIISIFFDLPSRSRNPWKKTIVNNWDNENKENTLILWHFSWPTRNDTMEINTMLNTIHCIFP